MEFSYHFSLARGYARHGTRARCSEGPDEGQPCAEQKPTSSAEEAFHSYRLEHRAADKKRRPTNHPDP